MAKIDECFECTHVRDSAHVALLGEFCARSAIAHVVAFHGVAFATLATRDVVHDRDARVDVLASDGVHVATFIRISHARHVLLAALALIEAMNASRALHSQRHARVFDDVCDAYAGLTNALDDAFDNTCDDDDDDDDSASVARVALS